MSRSSSSYSSFVTSDSTSPLDCSRGRVQLIGGDLYYSPNSQRTVHLPPVYDDIPYRDCFKDSPAEFRQPLWWQPACPYLAFVPLRPVFAGVPFQELFHISYIPRLRYGGFSIDPQLIVGWARLERNIRDAVELLLSHNYNVPAIAWIVRTSLGCTGVFRRVSDLRASFTHSKDWFSLFMGALSYAIAVSISLCQERLHEEMPHWFSFLHERDYSQIWLSGIRSSMVATLDSSVDRAGVFVQLYQRHRDQFSVDWLCGFGIPVWYPWGTRETRASLTDTCLARFAPLPHQLQKSTTFLTKNPGPQPQPTTEPQTGPYDYPSPQPQPTTAQTGPYDCKLFVISLLIYIYFHLGAASSAAIPSWKAFFEKRRARNERLKARETPKERQSRESREKNPPTKRTKVFLWTRTEDGGYRRESFYQSENGMHLDSYGKNQKIYDAFSNEWDCCSEFGEVSQDDVDDDDGIDDDFPMMPPPSAAARDQVLEPDTPLADPPSPSASQPTPAIPDRSFSVARPAEVHFDWDEFETTHLLYQFYGFVAPLPLPTQSSPIADNDRGLLSTIVGLRRKDSDFFSSPVASFALEFLQSLKSLKTPKNSSWDIASGNRMSIASSKLFGRMRVIKRPGNEEENWYVFDFKEAATVPWMVALPNVIDALFVCRLHQPEITDFEVARELLNHGIRFSTLLPVRPLPSFVGPVITVPVRLPGYEFTQDDYYAYEQQRAALLSDPRVARAALLRGGIVWRLAVATLSFDDVLEGPTTAATLQRRGIIIRSENSVDLCDDGLSQLELDIICGLHHCLTGIFFLPS